MKLKYSSSDVAAALNPDNEAHGWASAIRDPDGAICAWSEAPSRTEAIEMAANIARAMNAYYIASEASVYGEQQFNANESMPDFQVAMNTGKDHVEHVLAPHRKKILEEPDRCVVQLRLDLETKLKWERKASESGITLSEWIRRNCNFAK